MLAFLDWAYLKLEAIFAGVHAFAALMGVLVGVALTEAMAHALPPSMPAYNADRLTRLVCFGVSSITTLALDTTVRGAVLALLAGLAGPTLHGFLLRYVNARWPALTPPALVDCPGAPIRPVIPPKGEGN